MEETWICSDCHSVGVLNTNGRCETCGSDSVYPAELVSDDRLTMMIQMEAEV